jgi:DNA polymerase-1
MVPSFGPKDALLIVIGEAPTAGDVASGMPFSGQSGALIDVALQEENVSLDDVYRMNVVACNAGSFGVPEQAVACCTPRVKHELKQHSAERVVALGKTAHEFFSVSYSDLGTVFEREGKLVVPNWHPTYVLKSPKDVSEFYTIMRRSVSGPFSTDYIPKPEVRWAKSVLDLTLKLNACPDGAWVSFDIETDQVQWYDRPEQPRDCILMLQITWSEKFGIVIGDDLLYDEPEVPNLLQKFFNRVRTVAHNGKFDCVFLKAHLGVNINQDFDTMLAHYTLNENSLHGLKFIARNEFGMPDYEEAIISKYLSTRNDRYSKIPPEDLATYGVWDIVVTLKLRELFAVRLEAEGLYEWPFMNILMAAANALVDVEIRGMLVDTEQLDKASADLKIILDGLVEKIRESVGEPGLNPGSTQQLAVVLFDKLKLPIIRGRKVKPRSTAHEVLDKLMGKHPVIPLLIQRSRVQKIRSSYVENIRSYVGIDGRVHANFRIQGTEVSRLSVSDPALQTIPRPSDYYGALIRSAFIARPGYMLAVADFSQAEYRTFTCMCLDPFLLQVFKDGRDLHSEVALGMYGESYTKEQRVQAKMFNFSYLYGGTEHSFAQDAGLPIDVARRFVSDYNRLMPVAREFKAQCLTLAKTQGYVQTRFGRKRRFPLITQDTLDEARKASVHMLCASSASDLTLLSAIDLQNAGVPVVLTVHDSVIAELPISEAEDMSKLMVEIMKKKGDTWFPEVPWKVDLDVRLRWVEPLPLP